MRPQSSHQGNVNPLVHLCRYLGRSHKDAELERISWESLVVRIRELGKEKVTPEVKAVDSERQAATESSGFIRSN